MKKIALFVTVVFALFALVACGETAAPVISGVTDGGTITVPVGDTTILEGITATDSLGNALEITVSGLYDLDTVDTYTNIVLTAVDSEGKSTVITVTLVVRALSCEEDPGQDECLTSVDIAREEYGGTIYNVDNDDNGVADWTEMSIDLTIGFSYYGADNDTNAVWMNIEKFMEQYPNITVTRDPLYSSGWDNGDDGLLLIQEQAAQEGTLPDVYFNPKGAETYDRGMTLDLTPYLATDEESVYITENALSGMYTYDNAEIWGIPWQGVGPMVAINLTLLSNLGIEAPDYDWTYEEYEALRDAVGAITDTGACVFPGVIDFSIEGSNYFDSVPGGYKGYNIVTQRFDFASALNYGSWLEQVAAEAKNGWHFYDLSDTDAETLCPDITDSWTDGVRAINTIMLYSFNDSVDSMVNRGYNIDIYPFPTAPEGGTSLSYTYYDYYSLSSALEQDRVKAEAAYALVKWLTYGEDGTASRWSLIDEMNVDVDDDASNGFQTSFSSGNLYLMDYIQGWPITSNPTVLANHPLVKGFSEESGLSKYNFAAFQLSSMQYQLSNANPYPRNIPAFASVANAFDPWDIKNTMRDESLSFIDIAPGLQAQMNAELEEYLQNYIGSGN